jgi:hypothetical protein
LPRVSSSDRYQQEKVYECSDITQWVERTGIGETSTEG